MIAHKKLCCFPCPLRLYMNTNGFLSKYPWICFGDDYKIVDGIIVRQYYTKLISFGVNIIILYGTDDTDGKNRMTQHGLGESLLNIQKLINELTQRSAGPPKVRQIYKYESHENLARYQYKDDENDMKTENDHYYDDGQIASNQSSVLLPASLDKCTTDHLIQLIQNKTQLSGTKTNDFLNDNTKIRIPASKIWVKLTKFEFADRKKTESMSSLESKLSALPQLIQKQTEKEVNIIFHVIMI